MRARLARQAVILAGAAIVLVGWLARPRAQTGEAAKVVFAPGAEVAGAAALGKADTATAQKLARKKKWKEAVALFEKVALAHPSVVHDCNLSLAYLRAGDLTRAQLVWDVSRGRGAQPPDWCDASLSGQLASELRTRGYVPLTLNVQPSGALVEVAGIAMREMGLMWLPPATYQIRVTYAGWYPQLQPVLVSAPSASANILLVQMADPTVERDAAPSTDAGVVSTSTDAAAIGAGGDVDAATVVDVDLPELPPQPARAKWPGYAGVGAAGVGIGLGVAFHMRALGTKDRANMLPTDSVGFRDARDRFGTERTLAIGGYVVSAAAIGFTAWWWLGKDQGEPAARTVGVDLRGDGAILTFGGTLP